MFPVLDNQFDAVVAEGRDLPAQRVTELTTSQLYTGTKALAPRTGRCAGKPEYSHR